MTYSTKNTIMGKKSKEKNIKKLYFFELFYICKKKKKKKKKKMKEKVYLKSVQRKNSMNRNLKKNYNLLPAFDSEGKK